MKFNRKNNVIGLMSKKPIDVYFSENQLNKYKKYKPSNSQSKDKKQIRTRSIDRARNQESNSNDSSCLFNLVKNSSNSKLAYNQINNFFRGLEESEINLNPVTLNFKRKRKNSNLIDPKEQSKVAKMLKQFKDYTKQFKLFLYDVNSFLLQMKKLFSTFFSGQFQKSFACIQRSISRRMNMLCDIENQIQSPTNKIKQMKISYFDQIQTVKEIQFLKKKENFSKSIRGLTEKKTPIKEVIQIKPIQSIQINKTRGSTPEHRSKSIEGNFKSLNKTLDRMKDLLKND